MEANKAGILEEKGHKTMFHELLSTDILPPTEKTEGRLRDEVQTTVAAGTETVAHTLRVITYHLCTKPHMLARLRQELTSVPGYSDGTMKWYDLEKLPYLTAVITEGMRLSYGLATRLARIAPDRELEYGGYTIPRGSPVSMTNMLIFQNEDIFPDALSFVPDRWMDPEERRRLDKYYQPFMKGPRNCLGFKYVCCTLPSSSSRILLANHTSPVIVSPGRNSISAWPRCSYGSTSRCTIPILKISRREVINSCRDLRRKME